MLNLEYSVVKLKIDTNTMSDIPLGGGGGSIFGGGRPTGLFHQYVHWPSATFPSICSSTVMASLLFRLSTKRPNSIN